MPCHRALDVLRIRHDFHNASLFERRQTGNHGLQFHAIVRGVWLRADEFFLDRTASQQTCPASRPRISEARTICEQNGAFHRSPPFKICDVTAETSGTSASVRSRSPSSDSFPSETSTIMSARRLPVFSAISRAACNSRSEEHTSELQSLAYLVCRLLLEKKKK